MLTLAELKRDRALVDSIDWDMTPEKAVDMYLEWGAGWVRGHDFVAGENDESVYFVLYDWEGDCAATLIRRTVDGAEEIARIQVPETLFNRACDEDGRLPGGTVHRLSRELIDWISERIGGAGLSFGATTH